MSITKSRNLIISFVLISVILFSYISANALTSISDDNLTSSNTQVINLISYAMSYDDFLDSDYVVYRTSANDYYCVWGDLTSDNRDVTSLGSVDYVRYHRTSNTASWQYNKGVDSSFTLNNDYAITSNLPELGFTSSLYGDAYYDKYAKWILIFVGAFVFAILLVVLRKGSNGFTV